MNGMLDYLRWRGDLSLGQAPLNDVDALILSELSYIQWQKGLSAGEQADLTALWQRMRGETVTRGPMGDGLRQLFELAATTRRFGGVTVGGFVEEFAQDEGLQFAAVTFGLQDGTRFIAYRGTDGTLVGWKEDCSMAFSEPVPAQRRAADYLTAAAAVDGRPLRLGGHSKGGNLAVYAAATAPEAVRARIQQIYSFDGPGLSDQMDAAALYARLNGRLRSFVPQDSVIGVLLTPAVHSRVVRSDSSGLGQHNPFNWHVMGADFVAVEARTRGSQYVETVIRSWLGSVSDGERRMLIDVLFDVLGATDARSFGADYLEKFLKNPLAIAAAIQKIAPENRQTVLRLLGDLAAAALRGDEQG